MSDERSVAENLASYLVDPAGLALPELSNVEEAASRIVALYEQSGRTGATFSLRFGDMRGQPLFSVSVWPERGRRVKGDAVKLRVLEVFIMGNLDLLNDPRGSIGLWYNADDNLTYLDIVATLPSRHEAVVLASQYDQIAIFSLEALDEIETGGTGNTPAELPPAAERLPKVDLQEEGEL